MSSSVSGKVVLITGGASGIGAALATKLAEQRAVVWIADRQAAMGEVGRRTGIPLATNMCTTSFYDIPGSVQHHSEDIILSDHHFWGGLRSTIELARICQVFGRGLSMHSNSHVGISLAAMAHLAAAIPNLTYACDTHYPWQSDEVIVGGKFQKGSFYKDI